MSRTPSRIGLDRILELLGQGGMGIVYRGIHQETGASAAIKTVRVPHEGMLQSIRREIHALFQLKHPGIVPILGEGLERGTPWYAMELLDGVTLRQQAARLGASAARTAPASADSQWWTQSIGSRMDVPTEPADLHEADTEELTSQSTEVRPDVSRPPAARGALLPILTLVRRLCSPLAFVHGEGLVHRDLKPGNVLIRSDGWPMIVDFGLASRFGAGELNREALESAGKVSGTVLYMAPEQGRGELVDARADLYSLGCILYELVVGRPPFVHESPVEVLIQHLESEPAAPSSLVSGVAGELDELILRLLEKQPHRRLGHADDVAAALTRLGAGNERLDDPQPRPYLYRPRFIGRAEPFSQLSRGLDEARSGSGSLLLVGGESGIGKTRLVIELTREAQSRDMRVLTGECTKNGAALHPLRRSLQSVADFCRERGRHETERLLGHRGRLLSQYEPSLAQLPGSSHFASPAALPTAAAYLRLFTYLTEALFGLAAERPILLVLDDLHWADDLTLHWLGYLSRTNRLHGSRCVIVGTYRSEESDRLLEQVIEASADRRLLLGRFDERSIGSVVGDMLAIDPPPVGFVRFLSRESEGNPFFVAEYLRAALAEKFLSRDREGYWQVADQSGAATTSRTYETLSLPRTLRDLVARRLQGLPTQAATLVEAASICGREVDVAIVDEMLRLPQAEFHDALTELLRRQLLEVIGAERPRFVHDKVREVAYEQIPATRKRELHEKYAASLETRLGPDDIEPLGSLGWHWEQAGRIARASECYLLGARHAASRYAHAEAERLYRSYLSLVGTPTSESIAARSDFAARVLWVQGRRQEALDEHQRALEEARGLHDGTSEVAPLMGLGTISAAIRQLDAARGYFERGLEISRGLADVRAEAGFLRSLAMLHSHEADFANAEPLLEKALEIYQSCGDRVGQARSLNNLAYLTAEQNRFDDSYRLFEESLAIWQELGERREQGQTLGNLASLRSELGGLEEARVRFEEAIKLLREVGDRRNEAVFQIELAVLERRSGTASAETWSQLRQAEAFLEELGDSPRLLMCVCEQGRLDLAEGRDGRRYFERAKSLADKLELSEESQFGSRLTALRQAIEASESKDLPVFRGELLEDLPKGVRRWLEQNGQLEARS